MSQGQVASPEMIAQIWFGLTLTDCFIKQVAEQEVGVLRNVLGLAVSPQV